MDEDKKKTILYYVHDPMCSWCWGFHTTWQQVKVGLPETVELRLLLGGLAPDSDAPMAEDLQQTLKATWQRIEERIPTVSFNYDFWTQCQPRRSTYPACRAVIAARKQGEEYEEVMILAIQKAYYQQAMNPSDIEVLEQLAVDIGLDTVQFSQQINHPDTQQQLEQEISFAQHKGARGFPSLLLEHNGWPALLDIEYTDANKILEQIKTLMQHE